MCLNEVPVELAKRPVHAEQTEQPTNVPVNSYIKKLNKLYESANTRIGLVSQRDWSNNAH